jgi:hypothetical protein
MLDHYIDLDLLRKVIDALEVERNRNNRQDMDISRMGHQQDDLERRVELLEAEIPWLRQRVDRTLEVEQWVDPYSLNGNAICNSLEGCESEF